MASLIDIIGLSKSYQEGDQTHVVLDDINASIDRGELVVLLGRSGSGKSTLLNLLGGIDQPDTGTIRIAGIELNRLSERDRTLFRRDHIGFVFQFFNLLPTLTVEENLLLPLELQGRVNRGQRLRCKQLLAEVGLEDRYRSFPERLSGGERQRVAIARALVHEPDIVLADEPTGNLDVETGIQVIELLDRLTRASGKTLVMATHSRQVVGVSDRTLTIEQGKLVDRKRPDPR
jgi:putative ABC transport system ATP-binding protein